MNQVNQRSGPRMALLIALLAAAAAVTMVIATGLGPVSVPPSTTFRILLSRLVELPPTWETLEENIVLGLRLPRVCLGMIVGASLAVCGVTMQALVRNSLADPFILGVSNGAAAFATLGMLFGAFSFLGTYALSISAFIGSAVTILFVYLISHVRGRINITQLLLSGVAVSMIMDGITSIIKLSAPNALGLHNAEFWMSGSLAGAKWAYLTLPLVVLLGCMAVLMLNYRGLNLLLLGDESAAALGVNVRRLQKLLVLAASLMAGVTIARQRLHRLCGADGPPLYPAAGGRGPQAGPAGLGSAGRDFGGVGGRGRPDAHRAGGAAVGILTAVIGGPVFIWLLKKNDRTRM